MNESIRSRYQQHSLPCRLLYVIGQLAPGGAERQLCYLLQAMNRRLYNPAVVVWNDYNAEILASLIRSMDVPMFFPTTRKRIGKLQFLRNIVRSMNPEVVHSYSFYTNFAVWYAALGTSAKPIGSIRQDFVTERNGTGPILGSLSTYAPAAQIANSMNAKRSADSFPHWFGSSSKIQVVRNGLDLTRFKTQPIPADRVSLLAVGRLSPEKRWDKLLRCMSTLASKGLRFTVSLAGDGPLRAKLEAEAKPLVIRGVLKFLGFRQDIPELLARSTFLVHTADAEGCPNAIMEAMATGRAVVATDSGDVPYLVEHGKTGLVVSRKDEGALVQAVESLIVDSVLCQKMGSAGRARSEQEFSLDRLVSETLRAYCVAGWRNV